MKKLISSALSLSVLLCLAPALASASVRYASPHGTGPAATCPQNNPCDLVGAMDYGFLRNGDEVVFGPGTYADPSGYFNSDKGISVHGTPGEPRPLIQESSNSAYFNHPNLTLADVRLESTGSGAALTVRAGTIDRVDVRSTGGPACFVAFATVRDSLCLSTHGPGLSSGYSNTYTYAIKLRNVTLFASSQFSGNAALRLDPGTGNHITVDAKNVIAYNADPSGTDVYAGDGVDASSQINFAGSNYDEVLEESNGSVTPAGSGSNTTAPPLFVDAAGGDLHPATGSPTIDAGVDDALNGTTDLDGGQRVLDQAIDVGAYEYVAPVPPVDDPDSTPTDPDPVVTDPTPADPAPSDTIHPIADGPTPDTTITSAPARKVRRAKVTLEFTSDVTNARFACSVDGAPYGSCTSPFVIRLARGRHTIDVRASVDGRVDPTPTRATFKIARRGRAR